MTVDVHTHELARPFLVLATQNPVEYEGTYPLPEAQLDRFMVRVSLGYPTRRRGDARCCADHAERDRVLDLEPVTDVGEVLAAQAAAGAVHGSEALRRYVVALLEATRADPRVELGASPRAGLMLFKAAKAIRRARRPRPRAARRRPGARRRRARAPAAAGARGRRRRARGDRARRAGAGPRAVRSRCRRARRRAASGAALVLAAATFDSASLYVPGVALMLLGGRRGGLGRRWPPRGAASTRRAGPAHVEEERPYPLRVEVRSGLAAAARRRADRAAARLAGADRRAPVAAACGSTCASRAAGGGVLEPARLVIRDPLRLFAREVDRRRAARRCWCCRASSR